MIISHQGVESFRISQGNLTISVNPISKDSKFKSKTAGADITLITTNHPDLNGKDTTSRGEKESFVISGPGEYEVEEVSIKGFLSESNYGGEKKVNTIYLINLENINLCFLGALSDEKLSPETIEGIGDVDILFVPIGGQGVLSPSAAYKLAVSLEPALIIPMHYKDIGEKNALKTFLDEAGEEEVKPIDKLVLKKKDLEGKEGEVVILNEE